jgi:hypothetical protein
LTRTASILLGSAEAAPRPLWLAATSAKPHAVLTKRRREGVDDLSDMIILGTLSSQEIGLPSSRKMHAAPHSSHSSIEVTDYILWYVRASARSSKAKRRDPSAPARSAAE